MTKIIPRFEWRGDVEAAACVQRPQRCRQYFKPNGPARAESYTEFPAEIRDRYARHFLPARSEQNTVFKHIGAGRVWRTLQTDAQKIRFIVEIKPQVFRVKHFLNAAGL